MLKQEIVDFYEERNIGLDSLIRFRNPEHLSPGQVEEAAVKLYKKLKKGLIVLEPRQMPRWIWRRASKLKGRQYVEDRRRLAGADTVIAERDAMIASLEAEIVCLAEEFAYMRDHLEAFGLRRLCWAIVKILFWCPEEFAGVGV